MPARNKVPRHLRDTSLWPRPVPLEEAKLNSTQYLPRTKAVEMYCEGCNSGEIYAETGVGDRTVRWLVGRCIDINPETGAIFGFFACKEGFRPRSYTRIAPFTSNSKQGGSSGGLDVVFSAFPDIESSLESEALHLEEDTQQFKIPNTDLLALLHEALKARYSEAGLEWKKQWPFTKQKQGYEALRRWRKKLRDTHPVAYVKAHFGKKAAQRLESRKHVPGLFENFRALAVRQLDFHKVDTACILVFRDPNGNEFRRPVERFWLGAIVTEHPVTLAGYVFVFDPSPNTDDVLDLVQSSLFPEKRDGPVSSLLPNGAVVIAGLVEDLYGSGFAVLLMDNASYNIAIGAVGPIMDAIGCMVSFGAAGKWWTRGLVEKFFAIFERKTTQTLPTTYGNSPVDPLKGDPVKSAEKLEIYVDDILETFEEFALQLNTRSVTKRSFAQTAINAVKGILKNETLGIFPQPLPYTEAEPGWTFFPLVDECKLCGNDAKGDGCYINLDGRQYTNEDLALRFDLLGKTLVVCRHRWNDNKAVAVVKDSGEFLGFLTPDRRARRDPMHHRLLKAVNAQYWEQYFKSISKSAGRALLERATSKARKGSKRKESRSALNVLRTTQYMQQTEKVVASTTSPAPVSAPAEVGNDHVEEQSTSSLKLPVQEGRRAKVDIPMVNRLRRNGRR